MTNQIPQTPSSSHPVADLIGLHSPLRLEMIVFTATYISARQCHAMLAPRFRSDESRNASRSSVTGNVSVAIGHSAPAPTSLSRPWLHRP